MSAKDFTNYRKTDSSPIMIYKVYALHQRSEKNILTKMCELCKMHDFVYSALSINGSPDFYLHLL